MLWGWLHVRRGKGQEGALVEEMNIWIYFSVLGCVVGYRYWRRKDDGLLLKGSVKQHFTDVVTFKFEFFKKCMTT